MNVQRGNFFMLFNNADRFKRYITSILIGLPTWFVIGVLVAFSSEFGKLMGIKEKIDPGKAIMYAYVAISIGDILIGFISQWMKSRKNALVSFLCNYRFVHDTIFYSTVERNRSKNVLDMCRTWFWHRLLGHIYNYGGRTVWY